MTSRELPPSVGSGDDSSLRSDASALAEMERGFWAVMAENAVLIVALREAEEVFSLCEHPPRMDPQYGALVEDLGERVGYGAMMASAQASWRAKLERSGYPAGGEHVAGPCFGTVQRTLRIIRAALARTEARSADGASPAARSDQTRDAQ